MDGVDRALRARTGPGLAGWLAVVALAAWGILATVAGAGAQGSSGATGGDAAPVLDNLTLWSALVAVAMPWLVATLNRCFWSSGAKFAVFAVCCVVASAGTAFFAGDLTDPEDPARALLVILVGASGVYKLWKRPIAALEEATTPRA